MRYVYLLQSIADLTKCYISSTSDLRRRLDEHNDGKSVHTSYWLADVLPRHTITASLLWLWLLALLVGGSVKAATESFPLRLALETFYRLRRHLLLTLDQLRTRHCHKQPPCSKFTSRRLPAPTCHGRY